mmetsp:Transcript_27444/g.35976  ORF Transcript_27444/g.35976 Transcript_27444/m.35976 type:complete len:309 (+) Transcript_27444:88-1014(+)
MDSNNNRAAPPPPLKSKKKTRSKPSSQLDHDMEEYEMPRSAGSGFNVARGSLGPPPLPSNNNHRNSGSLSRDSLRLYARKNLLDDTPETTIGPNVKLKGELEFERLLRIDGKFEGRLISKGDLIIGPRGVLIGDIFDMNELLVDGKVVGNISVEKLDLRDRASVHGNITCKSVRMDPTVVVVGALNVHPQAPLRIDDQGNIVAPEAEVEKASPKIPRQPSSPKLKQTKEASKPSSPAPKSPSTPPNNNDASPAKEEEKTEIEEDKKDETPPELAAPSTNSQAVKEEVEASETAKESAEDGSKNETENI